MSEPLPPPSEADRFNAFRQEILELDNRFAELGGSGIFDRLDQAGVLEHRLPDLGDVALATRQPPPVGRARLRGEFVQRGAQKPGTHWCDWAGLWDGENHKAADLLDPFCSQPEWHEWRRNEPECFPAAEIQARREMFRVRRFFDAGRHAQALEILHCLHSFWRSLSPRTMEEFLSLLAETQSRCGQLGGLETLNDLLRRRPMTLAVITCAVNTHLYQQMKPLPETAAHIRRGDELLAQPMPVLPAQRVAFLCSKGCFLNRTGSAPAALPVLTEALALAGAERGRLWLARCRAELAETRRLLGEAAEARRLLVQAWRDQHRAQGIGDLGHFTLLYRAKVESRSGRAAVWLNRAERRLRECRDHVGELRCCLLRARLTRDPAEAADSKGRIISLRDRLPALVRCPKLAQVLERWDAWACGRAGPDEHGDFFWGV